MRQPEDWPWSSILGYKCGAKQAPSIPTGLCIDRLLLPADANMTTATTPRVSKAETLRYPLTFKMSRGILQY